MFIIHFKLKAVNIKPTWELALLIPFFNQLHHPSFEGKNLLDYG